jgi:hypothetical protein
LINGEAVIYVGLVTYGSTLATQATARDISKLRDMLAGTDAGPSSIDIVYVLGGRLQDVDFDGIRVGRLSKARQMIQVQIGMSRDTLATAHGPELITGLAIQAIRVGAHRLEAAGLAFNSPAALTLLAESSVDVPVSDAPSPAPSFEFRLAPRPSGYDSAEMERIEELLQKAIGSVKVGLVDGHEFGGNSATIFIRGADIERLIALVAPAISSDGLAQGSFLVIPNADSGEEQIVDLSTSTRSH